MRLTTAGESHGKGLLAILEGLPAGLPVSEEEIAAELAVRQSGYGRGARQKLEKDYAEILSGVCGGVTSGSPVALFIKNRDEREREPLTAVRPGHADLTGMTKFGQSDARPVSERASARESAARVAAGAVCRRLLSELGVFVTGYVREVGGIGTEETYTFEEIERGRGPRLRMMREEEACRFIDGCAAAGDTAGGVAEIRVRGLKSGFGSCMTYSEKLDACLAAALMSIQAAKGVEIGLGFAAARLRGSETHDEIFLREGTFSRKTNRAGGIEGGMSNGEELVLRVAMKPIPTLMKGLRTVDVATMSEVTAAKERADVCAVLAFEQIAESAVILTLTEAILGRLGGDTLAQVKERYGELPR